MVIYSGKHHAKKTFELTTTSSLIISLNYHTKAKCHLVDVNKKKYNITFKCF